MIGQIKDQGEFWDVAKESRPILDYGSDPSWTACKPLPTFVECRDFSFHNFSGREGVEKEF